MKSTVRFIYFDLAGVQYDFQTGITTFLKTRKIEYRKFAQKIAAFEKNANTGTISSQDLAGEYQKLLQLPLAGADDFFDFWTDLFSPITYVHTLVQTVAACYPIGILTNIHKGLFSLLTEKNLIAPIQYQAVIQSCDVGVVKPEKAIYILAQKKAGVLPEEILYIDDMNAYVLAAKEAGWKAIQFIPDEKEELERKLHEYLPDVFSKVPPMQRE